MAAQKPDPPKPLTAQTPALSAANGSVPTLRSEALEAELAMLEAILPAEVERSAQPTRVDPANDGGGAE